MRDRPEDLRTHDPVRRRPPCYLDRFCCRNASQIPMLRLVHHNCTKAILCKNSSISLTSCGEGRRLLGWALGCWKTAQFANRACELLQDLSGLPPDSEVHQAAILAVAKIGADGRVNQIHNHVPGGPNVCMPPPQDLSGLPPDSEEQQAAVLAVAKDDAFNWGYDPVHYSTPEGVDALAAPCCGIISERSHTKSPLIDGCGCSTAWTFQMLIWRNGQHPRPGCAAGTQLYP